MFISLFLNVLTLCPLTACQYRSKGEGEGKKEKEFAKDDRAKARAKANTIEREDKEEEGEGGSVDPAVRTAEETKSSEGNLFYLFHFFFFC